MTFGSRSSLEAANAISDPTQATQFDDSVAAARSARNVSVVSIGVAVPAIAFALYHQQQSTSAKKRNWKKSKPLWRNSWAVLTAREAAVVRLDQGPATVAVFERACR